MAKRYYWLKRMLLSLKDEGKLYFEGVEDNFASEIALALDEDAENVKQTLEFLQRHGMIEIGDDDEYQLTEVPAIIGSETASAMRVREHREIVVHEATAAGGRMHGNLMLLYHI